MKSKKRILEGLVYIALLCMCIFFIPRFVAERAKVEGTSMMTTLEDKDQLLVEKLSTQFDKLQRFDIIIFYPKGDTSSKLYIKRIIGLPGETVRIADQTIYINGEALDESYGSTFDSGLAAKDFVLGEDEYFVMGDNRANSTDSRYDSVGAVKRSYIEGKVILRIWPLTKFGLLD